MMEHSNSIAVDPWLLARDRYLEDLSEDEKALFTSASIENIFYSASAAQKLHEADSNSRLAARKLKPLIAALEQYGKALDVISNASPIIMGPLWGSIRVVLQLAGAFDKYFSKLVDMFSRIGDVLPQFQAYARLFPNYQRLLQVMSIAYLDIIKFCVEAKNIFREGNKLRGIRIAWKGTWKTFDSRFDESLADFRNHKKNVETEAMLSHMIEAGKARELELRERALAETRRKEESRRRLLQQLSTIDADYKHRKLRQLRHEGTGNWIKSTSDFKNWMNAAGSSCLSCYGIPGSGKTVLTSSVVDSLLAEAESTKIAVASYYCDYSDSNTLTALSIFGTLIKQLLSTVTIPQHIEQQIDRCYAHGARTPDSHEMLEIFVETLKLFSKVYLVIDGLDECKREEHAVVLSSVKKLVVSDVPELKLFVSSREEADITACLEANETIHVTEESINPDIELFVTEAIDQRLRSGAMVVHNKSLRQEIITGLIKGARGMFLWVSFQLDDLCEATSDHEIRETLRNLPRDLAETYSRILRRIKDTRGPPERLKKIQRIFKWVICAERPLTIDELTEAIAIDNTDQYWDPDKMSADGERLIRYCGSLVTFDKEDGAVRLAHYTVQQFLLLNPTDTSLASFHIDLSTATLQLGEACITYLSFSDFETQVTRRRGPLRVGKTSLLDSAIDQVPFGKRLVKDAITSWNHVRRASANNTNPVIDLTNHLFMGDNSTSSEGIHAKYRFLKYTIDNWAWHTRGLIEDNQRIWNAFTDLALEKQMSFDFRPWDNVQIPYDFPYSKMFSWAIEAEHVALLRLTPFGGADMRSFLRSQAQPSIITAARKGSTEFLEVLCKISGLSLRDLPTDEIVCDAAAEGRNEHLDLLLRLGADPNAKSLSGKPALLCAFQGKHQSAFTSLSDYGAFPDLQLSKDPSDDDELILVELNKSIEQPSFPLLYLAASSGHIAFVAALLEAGATVNVMTSSDPGGSDTPLQAAVERGHCDIVNMLLRSNANVNYFSTPRLTALQLAAKSRDLQLVKLLLSAKADPNLNFSNDLPLFNTAERGDVELVELLLAAKADPNLYSRNGMTPLRAAAAGGHFRVVKALLAAGAAVNLSTLRGPTALQAAARDDRADIVKLLLKEKADIDAVSGEENHTPLLLAARNGHSDMARILLAAGADVTRIFAARDEAAATVNDLGETALMIATIHRDRNAVQSLLEAGAAVNACSNNKRTALMKATESGNKNITMLLLCAGANVNAVDYFGRTALMEAVIRNDLAIVELLLIASASSELRNKAGVTALDLAWSNDADRKLIEALEVAEVKNRKLPKR